MPTITADLANSPLLQGTNARGRLHYLQGSITLLRAKRDALYPQIMTGDREAALDAAALDVQIGALRFSERQLTIEADREETELRTRTQEMAWKANEDFRTGKITAEQRAEIQKVQIPAMLSAL